ncbi:MAG: cysteine sulfinate desulfinase [Deltaproteobacteria bacterium CG2_30_66_27]|nr:MAG: cysteine sulfinate desulfinase [Deltaproteobacteria bacterium CG2_30_66_27]PJB32546.1 MAG: cysteine desulfurase CsdA [Deltaproteobacteria bacterium CG_4_9_14_3_um_filter_65_9]
MKRGNELFAVSGDPTPPDMARRRSDFPILKQRVHGKPLVYLDNASTTQKPRSVIEAITRYYETGNANVHRGVHVMSERATQAYEEARSKVARFLHARDDREIIFVRGATEAINLVAQTFGRTRLGSGDEVLITAMEHHSNIVPWQMLREQTGAVMKVAPVTDAGELDLAEYARLLNRRTRLVSVTHVSNALGTVNPVREMIEMAHLRDIPVLVDGAQAAPHMKVDVQSLDCDFYAFSGHKTYGPTGIGVLYGKAALLDAMPPYQGGGDMILQVSFEKTLYNAIPYKFEAGTPDIAGAIGLGVAIEYLEEIGMDAIAAHEHELLAYATEAVRGVPGIRIVGTAREKAGVLSFVLDGAHPHDIGTILDHEGIAIRAGHHCAMPLMERLGLPATARASFGLYNTREEVDALVGAIKKVREMFS